jgi:hypothetical protein
LTGDPSRLLCDALRTPERLDASYGEWEALIRHAREADLLGTLAHRIDACSAMARVPEAPRAHLLSAQIQCRAQRTAVRREIDEVAATLKPLAVPVVVLKGAAYLLADLPPSRGRLFSDIDILVPKAALGAAESALMLAGFATTHLHPYDQRYYRRWMHELPPMQHVKRLTVLDVHHTIVPETARVRLDPRELFRAAMPLDETPGVCVLAPADMVLHSATHLFHNEDFTHALRDLVDIDALLGHFACDATFWHALTSRAAELDLGRSLYYALGCSSRILATSVPPEIMAAVEPHGPPAPLRAAMDRLFATAMRPAAASAATRFARRALYVRGHWLKMPVPLLAWHLTVKSLRREEQPV